MERNAKEVVSGDNDEEVCNILRFAFYFLFEVLFRILVILNKVFFVSFILSSVIVDVSTV